MINYAVIFRIIGIFLFVFTIVLSVNVFKEYAPNILSNCVETYTFEKTLRSSLAFNETRLHLYFPQTRYLTTTVGTSAEAQCNGFFINADDKAYFLCEDGKLYRRVKECQGHSWTTFSKTTEDAKETIKVLDSYQKTQYLNSSSP